VESLAFPSITEVLAASGRPLPPGTVLGRSRGGHDVVGYRFGAGSTRVSLIAGCHADEPVGPMLLASLVRYLACAPAHADVLTGYEWWIVPHINPDGAERNRAWAGTAPGDTTDAAPDAYDFISYLEHVVREKPGDDIEFGFPRDAADTAARPEPRAVADWWRSVIGPFALHVSLHGMATGAGPWYLIDAAWADRCDSIVESCRADASRLGYRLHDVQRHGEKGFTRIARGFCTRPDSESMRRFFEERGESATAALFRPSSMETVRAMGGDALTLVSEVPLFTLPGVGETIDPVDPVAQQWRDWIVEWQAGVRHRPDERRDAVREKAARAGLRAVPVRDQLELQWGFIRSGVGRVSTGAG
jgi:hypothetical protein